MNRIDNYLHEFLRVLFANRSLIKRIFLIFAVITLLLPLVLKQHFEITAEVLVQSKKLSQADARTSLAPETDKFIPSTLADMETESNILRSPTLIRNTLEELINEGTYQPARSLLTILLVDPFKRFVAAPLRQYVINPLRQVFGLEVDPVRDTRLDAYMAQAIKDLKIEVLPGSNVILVSYTDTDPARGTMFVQRLLSNYLSHRQQLQSNDLPEVFYEQKKSQYQERLGGLERQRLILLESIDSSDPKEEITFRLNAINTEEQALNLYRDRALENQHWLTYLKDNFVSAKRRGNGDRTFPFTFANIKDQVAYEDREIKQLGEQLAEQTGRLGDLAANFQTDSLPMRQAREQLARTYRQFLQVVENRISERTSELDSINQVIAQKSARISEYKERIHQLQETQSQLRQLETEIEALHQAFYTYTQHYEESRGQYELGGNLSNARILSQPYEPTEPAFPKPMQVIPLGLLTGLLLAVALGYVREFFDHRFKHADQITQHLGLPVLMVINAEDVEPTNPHRRGSWQWLWRWARQ